MTSPGPTVTSEHRRSERTRCVSSFSPASSIGTSTESLISVLDHESCESLLGCLEESIDMYLANQNEERNDGDKQHEDKIVTREDVELNTTQCNNKQCIESTNEVDKSVKSTTVLKRITSAAPAKKLRAKLAPRQRPSTACAKIDLKKPESCESDCSPESLELTPWERWMLRKAAEERRKGEQLVREQIEREEARKREVETLKQKGERTRREIASWCQRKKIETAEQRQKRIAQAAAEAATETSRLDIARKADENFRAWLQRKATQEAMKRQSDLEKHARQETKKEARKAACEEEFEKWYRRSSKGITKSRSMLNTGPLGGGNSVAGCIVPSFYNPIPWQPNAIPRVQVDRKVSRSKYQWRPTQYA